MKIAIFHNFLDNIGGAEIVSLILARELNADIYTTNIDAEKIVKMGFEDVLPRIFSIGKVPTNAPFRQQMALLRFRFLNLNKHSSSEPNNFFEERVPRREALPAEKIVWRAGNHNYDFFIIAGDWAVSASVNNKPNLWYVHSPIREIWDLYEETRNNTVPYFARWIFDVWVYLNRFLNKKYLKSVQKIVCNSENTKNRVKKYLGKNAEVIFPPVDTNKFHFEKNEDYWLSVNRLITHKRILMQLEAFKKLPNEKLVIVGSYEKSSHFQKYAKLCQETKPKNIEIKSWVSQPDLVELYANCKGFITTSKDEDFGLNVVEAMASGKPVIAPAEGGYLETVKHTTTGLLVENINEFKLKTAIEELSKNPEQYKNACIEQAQKFDTKIFIEKIKKQIFYKREI